jgi:hypothetical protein
MPTVREKITELALAQLRKHPGGVRYAELARLIHAVDDSLNMDTIYGAIWDLATRLPEKVYKPSRGLFRLAEFRDTHTDQLKANLVLTPPQKTKESDFYKVFADWLVNDLEECTKAIPLGGNRFRDRWGTPDVIGKLESRKTDILQAPTEIVSAEIKTDASQLIVAFGQVCAYCLFSHRAYLAVPTDAPEDELTRLESLCRVFGIGLILFDVAAPTNPNFNIRVRARKQEPDMFYANKYMKVIEEEMWS